MLTWPSELPLPFAGGYAPFVRSLSGGQSLSGFEQVQTQLHDRWSASFSFHLSTTARILAARALLTRLRGRANTVALPAFDNARAPLSAATVGSPLGTTVLNPAFARASVAVGSPLGSVVASPVFSRRWVALAGTAYEFEALAGITGNVTILANDRVSLAPTGTAPLVGQYVTLASVRREILAADFVGGNYILRIAPPLSIGAEVTTYPSVGVTGTATIVAADYFTFVATAGAPQVGDQVTLSAVARTLVRVAGSAPYQCTFTPPLTVAATTPGSVAAVLNANAAINAVSVDIHVTTGVAPSAGHLFGLGGSRLYSIDSVSALGGSVYRCAIWPWLRAAASSGATVDFTTPKCEMRLASDAEGAEALRSLSGGLYGDMTLRFDEAAAT